MPLGLFPMQEGSIAKMVYRQIVEVFTKVYSDLEALEWMLDIARGLDYLHTLPVPVVHRVSNKQGRDNGPVESNTHSCKASNQPSPISSVPICWIAGFKAGQHAVVQGTQGCRGGGRGLQDGGQDRGLRPPHGTRREEDHVGAQAAQHRLWRRQQIAATQHLSPAQRRLWRPALHVRRGCIDAASLCCYAAAHSIDASVRSRREGL